MFKPEIMEIPDEWDYDTEVSGALTLVVPETSIKHMRCQTPEAASCKEEKPGAILSNDRRKLPGGRSKSRCRGCSDCGGAPAVRDRRTRTPSGSPSR